MVSWLLKTFSGFSDVLKHKKRKKKDLKTWWKRGKSRGCMFPFCSSPSVRVWVSVWARPGSQSSVDQQQQHYCSGKEWTKPGLSVLTSVFIFYTPAGSRLLLQMNSSHYNNVTFETWMIRWKYNSPILHSVFNTLICYAVQFSLTVVKNSKCDTF